MLKGHWLDEYRTYVCGVKFVGRAFGRLDVLSEDTVNSMRGNRWLGSVQKYQQSGFYPAHGGRVIAGIIGR